MSDIIKQPSHYARFTIEPVTFCMMNGLIISHWKHYQYACRAGYKIYDGMDAVDSEITDLRKVMRYAEMRINQLEGKDIL